MKIMEEKMTKRRTYDQDFKRNAVLLCAELDRTVAESKRDYLPSLTSGLLYPAAIKEGSLEQAPFFF